MTQMENKLLILKDLFGNYEQIDRNTFRVKYYSKIDSALTLMITQISRHFEINIYTCDITDLPYFSITLKIYE